MILIQPEWESATPNQPADGCRTDWFMPRVAIISTNSRPEMVYMQIYIDLNIKSQWILDGKEAQSGDRIGNLRTSSRRDGLRAWTVRTGSVGVVSWLVLPTACVVSNYQVQCIGWGRCLYQPALLNVESQALDGLRSSYPRKAVNDGMSGLLVITRKANLSGY